MVRSKKHVRIKPKYIKNAQGKIIQVFLDMKSYESMISRMEEFEAIKKNLTEDKPFDFNEVYGTVRICKNKIKKLS